MSLSGPIDQNGFNAEIKEVKQMKMELLKRILAENNDKGDKLLAYSTD